MVERFVFLSCSRAHSFALFAIPLFCFCLVRCQLLVGYLKLGGNWRMESPPVGSVPEAQDGSAWEYGAVVTRRRSSAVSDGSTGRWLRRHVEKVAVVSDWFTGSWLRLHVGKVAEVSDGSCLPKTLMGSLDAGSVVTWGWVPLSLMDLRGEGPVQGSGETSVLCFLFFPSCHSHLCKVVLRGLSQVPREALRNVCRCDAVHFDGWTGRRLRCHAKVGSGICVMSVLFAIFPCEELPTTLCWFFQAQAPSGKCLRPSPWSPSASRQGPSLRRTMSSRSLVSSWTPPTSAFFNFKSVSPALCAVSWVFRASLAVTCSLLFAPGSALLSLTLTCNLPIPLLW